MTLSSVGKQQAFAQESDDFLALLTIDHADLADPIRVVNNVKDVVSGGQTYVAFPFQLTLPTDTADSPPRARLSIDNVSQEIAQTIRSISTPPTVTIRIVQMADPEQVEVNLPSFILRNVKYDATTVSGELELEDITREPFPARMFSPAEYPGLLR